MYERVTYLLLTKTNRGTTVHNVTNFGYSTFIFTLVIVLGTRSLIELKRLKL